MRVCVSERVVNLVHDRPEIVITISAEPHGDGVERVAQDAREDEQLDRAAFEIDSCRERLVLEPGGQARSVARPVILIVERNEVPAVSGEHRIAPSDLIDLVEIEEQ